MAKYKSQKVTVNLTFDKPVTKSEAVKEFRNSVHGNFYLSGDYSQAGIMKIRGVGPGPKNIKRIR